MTLAFIIDDLQPVRAAATPRKPWTVSEALAFCGACLIVSAGNITLLSWLFGL